MAGRLAGGRNRVVSTPFGISSTRRASRDARAARSGVVAMTAAACLRPQSLHAALQRLLRPRLGELRVPEAVRRHVGNAEAPARDQSRDHAGDLEHPQRSALPHLGRVRERDRHRAHATGHRAGRSQNPHARPQHRVLGELRERFRQVAEVVEPVERAQVRAEVPVDQPRLLPALGQRADAPAQGRQQAHPHQDRFPATTPPRRRHSSSAVS